MTAAAASRRRAARPLVAGVALLCLHACASDREPELPPARLAERNAALAEVEARLADLDGADAGVASALVRHADHRVRRAAALRLMLLGDDAAGAIPELLPLLDDPEPRVRTAAARAIGAVGGAGEAGPLLAHLADPDRQVRVWVWKALRRIGDGALPAIADALSDRSPYAARSYRDEVGQRRTVRDEVIDRLGAVGAPAVPILEERLASADPSLQDGALRVLGGIGAGAQAALPRIVAVLDGAAEEKLAVRALQTIEKIGDRHPEVIPAVKRAAGSEIEGVAAQAKKTLAALEKAAKESPKGRPGAADRPKGKVAPKPPAAEPPEAPFDPNLD